MDEKHGTLPGSEASKDREDGLKPRERETARELRHLDHHLAGLYERGLVLLRHIHQSGNVYLVAHVGRELSRGVLNLLLSNEGLEVTAKDLENVQKKEKNRPRIAKAMGLEPDDRRVDEWFFLVKQFSKACHWQPGGPETSTVREAFERFASLLYGRLAPYYVIEAELDALLEIKTPTREHAKRLRDLQLRIAQRNYFFRKLSNPGWLEHLVAENFFKSPPSRLKNADGSWKAGLWPEGEYLVLATPDEPAAVLEVLKSIPLSNDNPLVWELVAKAVRQLPLKIAACFVPSLTNALKELPTWSLTESVADLIVVLAEAGRKESFKLAEFLFRVVDPSEVRGMERLHSLRPSDWVFTCLGSYDTVELLERVVAALEALDANRTLELLFSKVWRLQQLADDLNLGLGRRLVEIHTESEPELADDIMATLINEAVEVGQRLAALGRDEASRVMELVDQNTTEFVTRIGYLVLSKAGQHLQERLDEVLTSSALREPGFPATEIAVLLRSQFRNASPKVRKEYATAVAAGQDREVLNTRLRCRFGSDPTQEEIDQFINGYQHRILNFFRGDIPEELCDLAERLGVLGTTPSLRTQKVSEVGWYVGPAEFLIDESPISVNELAQSSVGEIVDFLIEWSPGDGRGSSSGLRRTLTTYAKENPGMALTVLNDALGHGVDPSIIEGTVDGFCEAADAGLELDWAAALAVVRFILSHVQSLDPSKDTQVDQWRRTTGRSIHLLKIGCDKNAVAHGRTGEVWGILGKVWTATAIWKVPHNDNTSLDSVVLASFNDATGNAANAAISAALWNYRSLRGDEKEASMEAKASARATVQKQLVPVLDRWLEEDGPNAAVVRAVMGEYLPQLHLLAPEWVEVHAANLFDRGLEDPASSPTWTSYISQGALYNEVFRVTRPWYLKAAENAEEWREAVGDSPQARENTQRYCEHLVLAVLRGLVSVGDKDALLETAYKHFLPSEWHQPYWGIFSDWTNEDKRPPRKFVQRLLRLWEWRISQLRTSPNSPATVEEAKELGWFFHTPYIPNEDRVRLGLKTARLAKGQLQMYSRWDQMLSLAQAHPDETFLIAEAVLLAQLRTDYPHVPVEDVRPFLAHILTAGRPDIQDRVRRLIHQLGERGFRKLKDLLDEKGRLTW